MSNTKVTQHVIANNAITADQLASAAVTDAKLHSTLDLSGKTLTLPATTIPSASTATTQAASDNSTKLATTAYVTTAIANLNDSAPAALNTLNELAAALGDDANFSATITTALGTKLPLAGGTLTGALTLSGAPTSALHAATKTYVDTADALKLNLSGGTLTGDLILNTTGALKIPVGTTGQRPTAATGQIRWNSTDGAIEVYNGTAWTAVGTGTSNKVLDTFTGNGSNATFTLSVTPANEDAIMVFIDGAYQEKADYTLTNNSLVLDTAPLNNEKIAVHITTAAVHDGTSAVNQQFTATAGQTAFTLSQDPSSENNTQVYINGVYQQKTDYTVVGTTLTFDTGLTVGDVVEVNMFTVATLGNSDTVTEGVGNLYHTTARARGAISVSGNAISYNSSSGVITANFEESPTFTGTVTSANIISTSNTATQFKNATDSDIQNKFETNNSSDYALHRLIGSDGVDNKFIIGYGPNHGSTPNHLALKNTHASGSIGFYTGASASNALTIDSSGNATFDGIIYSNSGSGTLQISGDSNANSYITSTGQIRFRPEGTSVNKIILDSTYLYAPVFSTTNGTSGIGVSPGDTNSGELGPGYLTLARDDTADADQIQFFKNGNLHSRIKTLNNVLEIYNEGTDLHLRTNMANSNAERSINFNSTSFKPYDSNTGDIDLGSSSGRWRDAYISGGIYFPAASRINSAVSNNNYLDDYEEGTWTPTIAHNDGSGGIPFTLNDSYYVKIGSLVYIRAYFTNVNPNGNAGTSSPYYGIRGFPFQPNGYASWMLVYAGSSVTSYGGYSSSASFYFNRETSLAQHGQAHVSGSHLNTWGSGYSLMMSAVYNVG